MFRLKIKTKDSTHSLSDGISEDASYAELCALIWSLTAIPAWKQKIKKGFPPQPLVAMETDSLKSLGIRSGDVLIVEDSPLMEEEKSKFIQPNEVAERISPNLPSTPDGTLLKKVVPSDNSCLFASVYYLLNDGHIDVERLMGLRRYVARSISLQPELYNEAVLERSNADYCAWITKETSWGGAIELSILCDYFQTEIVALDAKSGVINRFGEDKVYAKRILLMYDGIHYDPLYLETYKGENVFVFRSEDDWILIQAQTLVEEAKSSGQYTDVETFRIRCQICSIVMHGEDEVSAHARQTGHSSFAEVTRGSSELL